VAAIFEILRVTVAGGPVVKTISPPIIDASAITDGGKLGLLMTAALLSARCQPMSAWS
jgi:phosphate/sulfate permease